MRMSSTFLNNYLLALNLHAVCRFCVPVTNMHSKFSKQLQNVITTQSQWIGVHVLILIITYYKANEAQTCVTANITGHIDNYRIILNDNKYDCAIGTFIIYIAANITWNCLFMELICFRTILCDNRSSIMFCHMGIADSTETMEIFDNIACVLDETTNTHVYLN